VRILIIYSYFCTPKGYWSTRWYEFARRWVAEGHDVQVLSAPYEKSDIPKKAGDYEYDGIKLKVYNSPDNNRNTKASRAWNAVKFAMLSSLHVVKNNYDVVVASSGPLSVALPMLVASKFKKSATVFEVRDLWPDAAISMGVIKNNLLIKALHGFEKWAYHSADYVVTTSVGQQKHILKKYGKLKVDCISNSSDSYLFNETKDNVIKAKYEGQKLILHLGSLGFIHNCKYWIDLAAEIKNPNYHIVFIGDGNERTVLEHLALEKNLKNVEFIGIIPKTELSQWTSIAAVSLFSTLSTDVQETCSPNKLFDSLEAGLPLIQTTKGWISEMVSEYKVGLNISASSPKEAARQVEEYLEDEGELRAASIRAKKLAELKFNRDNLSSQYLELLNKIVA
jgi:glycosyltransferase involved in cell wall biosynthesis